MRLVVVGATGNVGRRIVLEAARRGHEVLGVVRDPEAVESPSPDVKLLPGDATQPESLARVARGADAVVSAISPRPSPRGLPAPTLVDNARALIGGLPGAGVKRVLMVGGAGSLEVSPGQQLVDQPGFPDAYKPEALDGRAALEVFRAEGTGAGLEWTFLSPAVEIGPGERTGRYRKTLDLVLWDAAGKSFISFEDFAVAVLDELERPEHVGKRFGVAY